MEAKVNLSTSLMLNGDAWLSQWAKIPQPPPKKFDKPPRGALGEALLTLQWTAEWALYSCVLAARRDAKEFGTEQLVSLLQAGPSWKELGSDEALKVAADLPEKYRGILAYLLYVRRLQRKIYYDVRPATATAPWSRNGIAQAEADEPLVAAWFGPELAAEAPTGIIPVGAAAWVVPVTVLGVAALCATSFYLSERAKAGAAVDAEKAFAAAQAQRDVKIATIQAAAGRPITVPDFVSRGAAMEAAQSSPWALVALGAVGGGAAAIGLYYGLSGGKKDNPSRKLGRVKTCNGVPVQVVKYKSGFRAWVLNDGRRARAIDVSGAKTYSEAFGKACYKLRKATKKKRKGNPTKKRKTAKRKASKRNPHKKTKRKRKANPKKKTKAKRKASKRNPKKKTKAKRKATKRNPKKKARRKSNPRKKTKRKASKRNPKKKTKRKASRRAA